MSSTEHTGSSGGGWLRRIADTLSGEPRDLEQLADVLADASERGLIDADVLEMLESVLQVSEIQVRDIMVPRSQMVVIQRDDPPEKILPVVIESGHSRFPVVGEDRDEVVGHPAGEGPAAVLHRGRRRARVSTSANACGRPCSFPRASA